MDSDVPTLEQDEEHREEIAIVFAIQSVLLPALPIPDDARIVRNLLRSVFPWGGMGRPGTTSQEHDPVLVDSIQCQFVADKLQATPQHVSKVCMEPIDQPIRLRPRRTCEQEHVSLSNGILLDGLVYSPDVIITMIVVKNS